MMLLARGVKRVNPYRLKQAFSGSYRMSARSCLWRLTATFMSFQFTCQVVA